MQPGVITAVEELGLLLASLEGGTRRSLSFSACLRCLLQLYGKLIKVVRHSQPEGAAGFIAVRTLFIALVRHSSGAGGSFHTLY